MCYFRNLSFGAKTFSFSDLRKTMQMPMAGRFRMLESSSEAFVNTGEGPLHTAAES